MIGNVDPNAAQLQVYDAAGRLVRDLSSQLSDIGYPSSVTWDGRDESGRTLPSGIYFVQFRAGNFEQVEKAVILRLNYDTFLYAIPR